MMSTRTPVFRAFPRVGVPPHYGSWEIYSRRVELMMESGAIDDYTYLWWDVRPHPNLGTVETRVFDQQTRLAQSDNKRTQVARQRGGGGGGGRSGTQDLSALFDREEPMVEYPTELIDDNKVRAAVRGLDGVLIDFHLMQGATATNSETAILKAKTAAHWRRPTRELEEWVKTGSNGAPAWIGDFPRAGGVPLVIDGMVAGAIGLWLFYIQHQFKGVYWERNDNWDYTAVQHLLLRA